MPCSGAENGEEPKRGGPPCGGAKNWGASCEGPGSELAGGLPRRERIVGACGGALTAEDNIGGGGGGPASGRDEGNRGPPCIAPDEKTGGPLLDSPGVVEGSPTGVVG